MSIQFSAESLPLEERGEIYLATNTSTGKSYVGQAVSAHSNGRIWGTHRRWGKHLSNARTGKHECKYLESAIAKYGPDVWSICILEYCEVDMLNFLEDKYIKHHATLVPGGYNLMTGGGNGRKHHEKTRAKMSSTRTGKTHSEETKKKMSDAALGKPKSEEARQHMREAQLARDPPTFSTRLNMSHTHAVRILEVLKELEIKEFARYIGYNKTKSGEGFKVNCFGGTKRLQTTSMKKTMKEKYQECLDFLDKVKSKD